MTSETTLDALRAEIDAIDDSLHELIMRRTKVVSKVRNIKRDERVKIRPAREAEILYRLMDQHIGKFPKRELSRMWRELIVATLSMEGPFSMAVYAPRQNPGLWDMARDQYGSFTPVIECASTRQVISAVDTQEATVGILPLPQRDDTDPWWQFLMHDQNPSGQIFPKVIARLPFTGESNSLDKNAEALVISPVTQRATGHDRSYFALEAAKALSSDLINATLSGQGATIVSSCSWQDDNSWLYLVETSEYMAELTISEPIVRCINLGGYALTISKEELDDPGGAST